MTHSIGRWTGILTFTMMLAACGADEDNTSAPPADENNSAANNNSDDNNAAPNNSDDNNAAPNNSDENNSAANNSDPNNAGNNSEEPTGVTASCEYTNPFSRGTECKQYTGEAWTLSAVEADCANVFGAVGTLTMDTTCSYEASLGECVVAADDGLGYSFISEGDDPSGCSALETGCGFVQGTVIPGNTCVDPDPEANLGVPAGEGFQQPYIDCRDPLEGEPEGLSEGGQVCTPVSIQGATEAGRRFEDYASCEVVISQRPYYPYNAEEVDNQDDARLDDEVYMEELAWVTEQVRASACVCCHSTIASPEGPSGWDVEAGPLWIDTIPNDGLAMMAGLAGSSSFGAWPAEVNNGFDRSVTGTPTTDIERMRTFLTNEYISRGFTVEQGQAVPEFGGPIYEQSIYVPEACEEGVGVAPDGSVNWNGGAARYIYVLRADAANPGTPPNMDEPEGTLWLLDVDYQQDAIRSGVLYGETNGDASQRIPADGPAPDLVSGETYYLNVQRDIGLPLARCLFEAP